jgi:hypothetical protein
VVNAWRFVQRIYYSIPEVKMMKRYFQLILIMVLSFGFLGMMISTDVYNDVQSSIVEVLCLSCLKLDPSLPTDLEYTFETANEEPHPDFVLENLSSGIVFLHYSKDACAGCDIMLPTIQELFSVKYGKEDMFQKDILFEGNILHYYYINIDHTTMVKKKSVNIYDKDHVEGLPMFTIVTLFYDHGTIKPFYTSLYGTLGSNYDTHQKRFNYLYDLILENMVLWDENISGYDPENS